MAIGKLTDHAINDILAYAASIITHVGLAYENPVGRSASLSEVTSPGYARRPVSWASSVRSITSTNRMTWESLRATSVVTWVLGFDAAVGGDAMFSVPISEPGYFVSTGLSLSIPVGGLVVGLDALVTP